MSYLLSKVNQNADDIATYDASLKGFLADLVTGIHQETISQNKRSVKAYKDVAEEGIDRYMGAEEYAKLRHSCEILL